MINFSKLNILKPGLGKLFKLFSKRQKIIFVFLILFTIGFSLVETLGISAIMPFISIVSDTSLLESGYYKIVYDFLGFSTPESFLIAIGIGIICFYIFRAVYMLLLSWFNARFSFGFYKYISRKLFKVNLSVSYNLFTQKNSAEILRSITSESYDICRSILYMLQICSELFTIIMVYTLIVILNWKVTLVVTAILLIFVIFLLTKLSKINKMHGVKRRNSNVKMFRILKETLGNMKYVKLKGNEKSILNEYNDTTEIYTRSETIHNFLQTFPKSILESLGFSFLIAVIVFIIWVYNDASRVIPVISMYALALYRILPSIHRMVKDLNGISFYENIIDSFSENLNQKTETEEILIEEPLDFNNSIRLENVKFKYITGSEVIFDISLEINKGEKIAITGESGSGKTTLVDIITGIHKPQSGTLYIDNTAITDKNIRSWRKKIGYIPQSIYLFDGTVAENVSFASKPDEEKIITALKKANIWDFLCTKEGINTLVGDGGIQLSGGQQQRIGIARALYDNPEVLVLDEATSALDNETEEKIMDEIYAVSENKTLIIIAHRITTVERCDRRICLENGKIV